MLRRDPVRPTTVNKPEHEIDALATSHREPIILAVRPAVHDGHVVALNVTGFTEKGRYEPTLGRGGINKTDYGHPLRAERNRLTQPRLQSTPRILIVSSNHLVGVGNRCGPLKTLMVDATGRVMRRKADIPTIKRCDEPTVVKRCSPDRTKQFTQESVI